MSRAEPVHLYGISNCDTVKRARAWLDQADVVAVFHDFKREPPSADLLRSWMAQVPWSVLVNRQGTTWRKLVPADQQAVVDAASAQALMLAQPSVIKRPVVLWPSGALTVGFAADDWQARI